MKIDDLYVQLEIRKKITVACTNVSDYYALRASIYRARKRCLVECAKIDNVSQDDGNMLSVTWDADAGKAVLELKPKQQQRYWMIIDEYESLGE